MARTMYEALLANPPKRKSTVAGQPSIDPQADRLNPITDPDTGLSNEPPVDAGAATATPVSTQVPTPPNPAAQQLPPEATQAPVPPSSDPEKAARIKSIISQLRGLRPANKGV